MTDQRDVIDTSAAKFLIDAFVALENVREKMNELQCHRCRGDASIAYASKQARIKCNRLIEALQMVEHCLREAKKSKPDLKVVE
jgi:uncharacterized protein YukE